MLEVLMFIAVFVILGQMWRRLQTLERRLELAEFHSAASAVPDFVPHPRADAAHRGNGFEAERTAAAISVPAPLLEAEPVPEPEPEPEPLIQTSEPVADAAPDRPAPVADVEPAGVEEEPGRGFGFEELFGRRLPIWAGGVTLAVAGVLIVRYSIEAGLLSPLIRFVSGLLFGSLLTAGAEIALRSEDRVRDPRVRQALSGAGIATLYASILVAANVYALIGPVVALAAMAGVTGLAMALSLRFGAPSALLGLVGGLAAPALVGAGAPNVPLLTVYLALAVGGLTVLSRTQRWMWLGASALVGGLGWGAALLLGGMLDTAASLSIGLYLLVVGIALPLVAAPIGAGRLMRIGGSIAAAAQMAALVATGGFSLLHWGLFGLISIAILWLSRREEGLARLAVVGLALVLLLLGAWSGPSPGEFALVLLTATILYGGTALHALWRPRGSLVEVGQIAALALGAPLLATMHFYRADHSTDLPLAALSLAAAAFPAAAAWLGWGKAERLADPRFALLVSAAGLLVATAAAFAVPLGMLPLVIAAIAVGLLLLSLLAGDARIEVAAWLGAVATVPILAGGSGFEAELTRLAGPPEAAAPLLAVLRWAGLGCAALVFASRPRLEEARIAAQAMAALLFYGAAAQVVPGTGLPLVAPAALLALAFAGRRFATERLLPAMAVTLGVSIAWTALPFLHWSAAALASLAGDPLFVTDLPSVRDAVLRLLVPSLLIGASAWAGRRQVRDTARVPVIAAAGAIGLAAAHILFKQVFGIASTADFVAFGVAERAVWTALLLAAAFAAWKAGARNAALVACGTAAAYLGWYTLILHNPLWARQAVGGLPLVNLLIAVYGPPLGLLALAGRVQGDLRGRIERPRAVLQMLLTVLFAYATLRQLVHGAILVMPGLSQGEDIARSILAVALAIGFLLWGIRTRSRDWRIGSLVLMLLAVAKVFLLDASGLEGLLRIASFVALGFSLIGIGWLYSRSLGGERPALSKMR
ncbi:MAG TPA: DUF2339 domain-containing protein [Allosphingosinicella sp.]